MPAALLDKLGKRLNEQRYNSLSAALLLRALDNYGQRAQSDMTLKARRVVGRQTATIAGDGRPTAARRSARAPRKNC